MITCIWANTGYSRNTPDSLDPSEFGNWALSDTGSNQWYGDGTWSNLRSDDWHAGNGFGDGPWRRGDVYPNGSGRGVHHES